MSAPRTRRGICPTCGQSRALNWDRDLGWTIRSHRSKVYGTLLDCAGSGKPAEPEETNDR